ncbi:MULTISPECIES: helix-turn-helix transcriptional regulator [Micromonospora]|uniref:XRE family transcriptional regulator n=1 Tax=Micromonospora solifontis TaxID=2487138 RepID=A0ABX9WLY0_9ACTN|nr:MULTISPECIES: helix-turn-helix transcriptional regulator [Micromonospora]NES14885.1 helix-turn-helix transcriptional regulator [Micromonospora sp. PPF5-17B]NES35192.1 helix-turn-helix transcriptional regulator [Micromonospora solifontis]NES55187.1 helix-turn-helix transcriptional regulator [Micromonospora sp. PPF5-6]RNM01171.1 XRE family transcriptional regulator [Micromonospora solifontis]
MTRTEPVGVLIRRWRERRGRSQLDVSVSAELSTRHLSFVETGRANPSRGMIERLCEELDVPLRERNALYLAAGFAPVHPERPFTDLGVARAAVEAVLAGHEPNPALAVNVRWELLAANQAMAMFLQGVPAELRTPRVNVLRATLHPDGLSRRIVNLAQWRAHVLRRVRRQLARTAAEGLAELLAELESYPAPEPAGGAAPTEDLVVPLRFTTEYGELALLYTMTMFGSPRDVTLDEISIETFFPADAATAELLRAMATMAAPPTGMVESGVR